MADEINRATPRTQSALLEAMQERQVTIDGVTRALPTPFFVVATLNPIEMEGTFPLPEAQLDRFLLRLEVGYPTTAEEGAMLDRFQGDGELRRFNRRQQQLCHRRINAIAAHELAGFTGKLAVQLRTDIHRAQAIGHVPHGHATTAHATAHDAL